MTRCTSIGDILGAGSSSFSVAINVAETWHFDVVSITVLQIECIECATVWAKKLFLISWSVRISGRDNALYSDNPVDKVGQSINNALH